MSSPKTLSPTARIRRNLLLMLGAAGSLTLLSGCHIDMWVQPRVKPYESSDFYPDGQGMRPLAAHTVDRTHYWSDAGRYTGYSGKKMVAELPIDLGTGEVLKANLLRGQERFNIYCAPCHGALGNGQGMIAQRGLTLRRQPGNYHTDRLRKMPIGHFYDVITNGYGIMFSYASRVEPDDRWRIAAYIRVLQRSQNAKETDLPSDLDPKILQSLQSTAPPSAPAGTPGGIISKAPLPGEIGASPMPRPGNNTERTSEDNTTIPAPTKQTPLNNGTNANGH